MNENLRTAFAKFDARTNDLVLAHIELSNTYLRVERGETPLTITIANRLRTLVQQIYPLSDPENDFIIRYWSDEFHKLPNWLNC
jgi:hypothetical protein